MSSHDDHASCPQCRMAAGESSLDLENPCNFCGEWTSKQWGKLRRSLVDARARASQRGRQHWSAAFPRLEAWILSKPVSRPTSVSEISSQAGEGDFEDNLLVWFIPAIPTGKPEFGPPNCPVRALWYYHRYLTEHPELRKDRRRLFVPIKDNNAGKELSASSTPGGYAP